MSLWDSYDVDRLLQLLLLYNITFLIFQVSVIVYDNVNPEKIGMGNLTISVRRNERGPRFDRTDYTETLLETTLIGTTVVTLRATDEDDQQVRLKCG